MKNRLLFSIILAVFIDLLGFSLILPLLPYYAETFKANNFVTGLLVAPYAAAQVAGAPLLGRLSDRHGRRPVLIASIFGTFIGENYNHPIIPSFKEKQTLPIPASD